MKFTKVIRGQNLTHTAEKKWHPSVLKWSVPAVVFNSAAESNYQWVSAWMRDKWGKVTDWDRPEENWTRNARQRVTARKWGKKQRSIIQRERKETHVMMAGEFKVKERVCKARLHSPLYCLSTHTRIAYCLHVCTNNCNQQYFFYTTVTR